MKLSLRVKVLQVLQRINIEWLCILEFCLSEILYPPILESMLGGDSVLGVKSQHPCNQIFTALADIVPLWRGESELSLLDPLEDDLVVLPVERWIATEEDIKNDSTAPFIAFLIILSQENFGCYIIGCTETSSQFFVWVQVLYRGTKVNDLDDVTLLKGPITVFKEKILRFQISVYNSVFVAVDNS
jgi:hypothetical protein